jgi:hypothetical protein
VVIPRFEPSMATRGRRRPQRANSAQGAGRHRVATRGGRRPRFEPSMATRGRRPPQHANSEQVVDRRECGRPPGGLAHQSRELARHFGKSPRNLMPKSETFCPNRLRPEGQEEGGTTGGMECGALLLCCCTVRCCCVVVRCVVVVVLLYGAVLLCYCCGHRLRVTTLSYNTGLIPSVVTLQLQHRVVTVGCCTAVLHCCAALLRCCAVLHCCVLSGGLFE